MDTIQWVMGMIRPEIIQQLRLRRQELLDSNEITVIPKAPESIKSRQRGEIIVPLALLTFPSVDNHAF